MLLFRKQEIVFIMLMSAINYVKSGTDCLKAANTNFAGAIRSTTQKTAALCWKLCQTKSWCYKVSYKASTISGYFIPPLTTKNCFFFNSTAPKKVDKTSTGYFCKADCKTNDKTYTITKTKTVIPYPSCNIECTCFLDGGSGCVSLCPTILVKCVKGTRIVTTYRKITGSKCTCPVKSCRVIQFVEKKEKGETLFLSCNTTSTGVIWKKDGVIVNTSNERYSTKLQALVITDLHHTDAGVYACADGFSHQLIINKDKGGGLSTTVIIAIAVVAAIIILIIIIMLVCYIRKRQPLKKSKTHKFVTNKEIKPTAPKIDEDEKSAYEDIDYHKPPTYETLQRESKKHIYEKDYSKLNGKTFIGNEKDYGYIVPIVHPSVHDTLKNYEIPCGNGVTHGNTTAVKNCTNIDTTGYIDMNRLSKHKEEDNDDLNYENPNNYFDLS